MGRQHSRVYSVVEGPRTEGSELGGRSRVFETEKDAHPVVDQGQKSLPVLRSGDHDRGSKSSKKLVVPK